MTASHHNYRIAFPIHNYFSGAGYELSVNPLPTITASHFLAASAASSSISDV
jgi:hypothetical protein